MTPHVQTQWPFAVDTWFRRLLRRVPVDVPADVTEADWCEWLTAVHHHTLPPLLYYWLQDAPPVVCPPAWVMEKLRHSYLASKGYVVYRWMETRHVLQVLWQAGVQAVVLKGSALAESCYTQPELRPSLDIDILIPQEQYTQAKAALLAAGYEPQIEVPTAARQWACEEAFLPAHAPPGRAFLVELHWSLSPYALFIPHPPLSDLFHRMATTQTADVSFPVPDVLDALVHTALHLVYGHPEDVRLIWLYDIHLLAQGLETAEWQQILQISQQWQARIALADALRLAHTWFGTPFPSMVTDLTHVPPTPQEQKIRELAFYRVQYGPQFARLQRNLHQLGQLSIHDKLQMAYYRLFPAREAIVISYPRWRNWPLPLVYLARLFLLLRQVAAQKLA